MVKMDPGDKVHKIGEEKFIRIPVNRGAMLSIDPRTQDLSNIVVDVICK